MTESQWATYIGVDAATYAEIVEPLVIVATIDCCFDAPMSRLQKAEYTGLPLKEVS